MIDYDRWKTTIDCDDCHSCRKCDETEQRLDDAREWLEVIQDQLYGNGELDVGKIENALDELSYFLGVTMKPRDTMPNIQRPITIRPMYMMDWSDMQKVITGKKL